MSIFVAVGHFGLLPAGAVVNEIVVYPFRKELLRRFREK